VRAKRVSVVSSIYKKLSFLKKKEKEGAKYTLLLQSKQNNNSIFQKSCSIYIFYKKIWY